MTGTKFSYDEVPYSSFTFPQTRPDRLATLAAIYGMRPAAPEKCRVLELGCGDGTNLLSFAYILPDSHFVGIDLSKIHIDLANAVTGELGLKNLEFYCEDVMNFTRERFGEFDYIIAHGLFSWVPDFVRAKVLEIYSECLAPQGVGYISYNTYPGCKSREMIWDMMKFASSDLEDPMRKVNTGVQFLNFINTAAAKDTAHHAVINNELAGFSQRTFENIFHDDFSSMNQPFYFHEFVDLIKPHGLQFLSEVNAFWSESNLNADVTAMLDKLGSDVVRKEQCIDFIKGTPFRSSLVCRDTIKLDRDLKPELLERFYLSSQVEAESKEPDLKSSTMERFNGAEGGSIETKNPLTKAALTHMQGIWSRSVSFEELVCEASSLAGETTDEDVTEAKTELFEFFKRGFVYLNRSRLNFPAVAGDRPVSSKFVRWQIGKKCSTITALSGMNLRPTDDLMLLLLMLCDGTRDRAELAAEVGKRIEFSPEKQEEMIGRLPNEIDDRLAEYARLGLLES